MNGILNLAFGFLVSKTRSEILKRLENGDVTDEECRRLIVRELDDIKTKLDGLARKDLKSSVCFFQEGVNGLNQVIRQFQSPEKLDKAAGSSVQTGSSEDNYSPDSCIKVEKVFRLINDAKPLNAHTKKRFKSAMESFKLAREKATEAFCNDALSIEDRIQATQVRMMARIFEKWEDPDAGVSDCLLYLKELHGVEAIQRTFSVLMNGGIMSLFNEAKRLNIGSSVHLMNQLLYDFARKFTKLRSVFLDWPMILFDNHLYHPVFGDPKLISKLKDSGVKNMTWETDFTFDDEIDPLCSVVNSKREIVNVAQNGKEGKITVRIFKSSEESRTLCEVPKVDGASRCYLAAMDIDSKDNLYLIVEFKCKGSDRPWNIKLFIFDENGDKKREFPLPFQNISQRIPVAMSVSKDGKIAIINQESKTLYIGNICDDFNLDTSFNLEISTVEQVYIRYLNAKIFVVDVVNSKVYVYTEAGELEHEFETPEFKGSARNSVAVNHDTNRIFVKNGMEIFSFLTGEIVDSLFLGCSQWIGNAIIASHPNGTVALVGVREAAFLQL